MTSSPMLAGEDQRTTTDEESPNHVKNSRTKKLAPLPNSTVAKPTTATGTVKSRPTQ